MLGLVGGGAGLQPSPDTYYRRSDAIKTSKGAVAGQTTSSWESYWRQGQMGVAATTPPVAGDSFCGRGAPKQAVRRSDSWAGSPRPMRPILAAAPQP